MQRISDWEQANTTGTVDVDFGDGIQLTLRDTSALPAALDSIEALESAAPAITNPAIFAPMIAGHGWTAAAGTAAYNLDDTTDAAVGDRCISITTDGAGGTGTIEKTGLNLDLTGKGLVFWVKVRNVESIRSVGLTIANAETLTPAWFGALPIQKSKKSQATENDWTPIYFSMGNAGINRGAPTRTPITTLRITVQDWAGTPAPTFKLGGVGTFDDANPAYPAGVISLTFDDTWEAHAAAAQKMAAYGFPGTEYLIQSRVGDPGRLSLDQLRLMKEAYGWEIGAHASTEEAHVDWTTKTPEWIDAELAAQKQWQNANALPTDTFAYPIGPFNAAAARLAEKYYDSARSTYPWTNSAATPSRYRLSCYVMASTSTLAAAKTYVDRAKANGGWPVFLFHNLVSENPTGNDWTWADFDALLAYIKDSGIPVDTVANVMRHRR